MKYINELADNVKKNFFELDFETQLKILSLYANNTVFSFVNSILFFLNDSNSSIKSFKYGNALSSNIFK